MVSLTILFEMLTLYPTLNEKEILHLKFSLYIETTFFQAPAKHFFPTELKKLTKSEKNPDFCDREN